MCKVVDIVEAIDSGFGYSREQLFAIKDEHVGPYVLPNEVLKTFRDLAIHKIARTKRGTRGGRYKPRPSQHRANSKNLTAVSLDSGESHEADDGVTLGLFNARSVKNKALLLSDFVYDLDLDLVCLTETWLAENDFSSIGNLCPPGYKFLNQPRVRGKGGGIALLYKSHLKVSKVDLKLFDSFECLYCLVQAPDISTFALSIVYRPPPNGKNGLSFKGFNNDFCDFLDSTILDYDKLLMVGDFNLHIDDENDKNAATFLNVTESYDLTQHVTAPTHNRGHTLDLIFTRSDQKLLNNLRVENNLMSDHYWILCKLNIRKPKVTSRTISYRNLKNISIDAFSQDIENSILSDRCQLSNLDEFVSRYNLTLSELLDKHAPLSLKKIVPHSNSPWYNSKITSIKICCRKAERKWRQTKLEVHKQIYLSCLETLHNAIKSSKKEYYQSKIDNSDPKCTYKIANTLLNKSSDILLPNFTSATSLATRFNKFFIDKIVKIRNDLQATSVKLNMFKSAPRLNNLTYENGKSAPNLSVFKPATDDEIKKIILNSKSTQCPSDPIPTHLLKQCITSLLPTITQIVNMSLSTASMPAKFKKAIVVPLLKKVSLNVESLKNFRPVSNLAFLSKVIEKVVAARLKEHMDTNQLHEIYQSAYKKFHSCETALLKVKDDILKAVDNKKCVLLVLLDLSAAFDTIDHDTLIRTLAEKIGLCGTALKWFQDYLSDRVQSVLVDGVESDIFNILFGVPQGSVLGPILFIIYTSPLGDIFRRHGVSYHLYADDTQIYISFTCNKVDEAFANMENCIADIKDWMTLNLLKLNAEKTEVIVIGSKAQLKGLSLGQIKIGTDSVTPTASARNIGVVFDSSLSMDQHVTNICKSAWHHLRELGKIRQYLDSKSAQLLIHSYVTSRLDNFNSLLFGLPQYEIDRLQRIQNAAARVVALAKKFDHITPVLKELHWLPITQRINFKILLLTFKALHNMAPTYITDLLKVSNNPRALRSNSKFLLVAPKTKYVKYGDCSFSYAAPLLWNNLPDSCRMAPTCEIFKNRIKTFLFKQAYDL